MPAKYVNVLCGCNLFGVKFNFGKFSGVKGSLKRKGVTRVKNKTKTRRNKKDDGGI